MATINVDETENLEKAIKRFKRMVEKEGIIREFKRREYFEKPSALLHQKKTTLERKLLNKRRKSEKKDHEFLGAALVGAAFFIIQVYCLQCKLCKRRKKCY